MLSKPKHHKYKFAPWKPRKIGAGKAKFNLIRCRKTLNYVGWKILEQNGKLKSEKDSYWSNLWERQYPWVRGLEKS